jgi:beta-phosphoglucomutase-like phosphatase (HAD superfamily)
MDGVLLDTAHIKLAAWSQTVAITLAPTERELSALNDYNLHARGIPRITKFEHVLRTMGAPQSQLPNLLARYSALLEKGLATPQAMPGAINLLSEWAGTSWVVSSAPQADIASLLSRAGFRPFDRICGYSTTKTQALTAAKQTGPTVHFGDAPADREAATTAGVHFIAVGGLAMSPQDLASCRNLGDLRDQIRRLLETIGGSPSNKPPQS